MIFLTFVKNYHMLAHNFLFFIF